MASPARAEPDLVTPEEYLRREALTDTRSELHHGEVRAMSGGSPRHGILVSNLPLVLGPMLRGGPCRYLSSDVKLHVAPTDSFYYPDAMIACPPNFVHGRSGAIDNPQVVFEVLSPSTAAYDRGPKFRAYEQVSALREIVFVETEAAIVEVHALQPDGRWLRNLYEGEAAVATLPSLGVRLPLGELYVDAFTVPS